MIVKQQREFGDTFIHSILPKLKKKGVVLDLDVSLDDRESEYVQDYFHKNVSKLIDPLVLTTGSNPPFLKNRGQYLVAELWPSDHGSPVFIEEPFYGLVEIPSATGRFVQVPSLDHTKHVLFVDDVIRANLKNIFPDYEVGESYSVKVTRDAELYIDDEFTGNLIELIRKSLSKRDSGVPTRFLYDMRMPYPMVTVLKNYFVLSDEDLVVGGRYHNFSDFFQFPHFDRPELVYQDIPPAGHPTLDSSSTFAEALADKDVLIFPPYQSYEYVLRFLDEAIDDPDTTEIYITLYRTARNSKVVERLVRAASAGKAVTAFIEVKARFDEAPNLQSAKTMEDAGIHVLYSMPGIKVHSKLLLVKKRSSPALSYIGTGNFNEKTALLYTDIGLFTSDHMICTEIELVFDYLCDPTLTPTFEKLLVAPFTMREAFSDLIEKEIDYAKSGRTASVTIKLNSLEDKEMITLLYRAANAGVVIRIICRGICCLDPDLSEVNGNIKVTSIVDRFLEHARVYIFSNDGNERIYIASADWMKRNLSRRVEVAVPIEGEETRKEIRDMMALQLADNTKARKITVKQKNKYVKVRDNPKVRAQIDTFEYFRSKV